MTRLGSHGEHPGDNRVDPLCVASFGVGVADGNPVPAAPGVARLEVLRMDQAVDRFTARAAEVSRARPVYRERAV
jgi:hypothetical protein